MSYVITADLSKKESVQHLGEAALEFCQKSQDYTIKRGTRTGTETTDTTTRTRTRKKTTNSRSRSIAIVIDCGGVSSCLDFVEIYNVKSMNVCDATYFLGRCKFGQNPCPRNDEDANNNNKHNNGYNVLPEAKSASHSASSGSSGWTILWISSVQGLRGIIPQARVMLPRAFIYCQSIV